jgi:hypothetical protein
VPAVIFLPGHFWPDMIGEKTCLGKTFVGASLVADANLLSTGASLVGSRRLQ